MSDLVTQFFNGLSLSSILLLVALGLAVIFGLMGVINMAHGELMMVGAYTTYVVQQSFAQLGGWWPQSYFFLAIPAAFIVTGFVGFILEKSVIRFLYARPLESLLATWGLSLILQQAFRNIFGANNVDVVSPSWLVGGMQLGGGIELPYKRLLIIGLAAVVVAATYVFLMRTKWGLRIRAVTQNRGMSACLGIGTQTVDAYTFALGAGLAGIAGCALTLLGSVGPTTGQSYIVDAFMVVVLGGVGKLVGVIAGGLAIGELRTAYEWFTTSSMGTVLVFTTVIAFLQFRPSGLFPHKGRTADL
jgi:urea transport system permease protein